MKGLDFLTSFLYESDFVCMVIQFEFRLFLLLLVLGQYDDHSPRMRVICRISRAGGMFIRWHLAGESEICSERASESVVLPLGGKKVGPREQSALRISHGGGGGGDAFSGCERGAAV